MATQIHHMDEGRPPEVLQEMFTEDDNHINENQADQIHSKDTFKNVPKNKRKTPTRQRKLSIASISKSHLKYNKYGGFFSHTVPSYYRKENVNMDTNNLVRGDRPSLINLSDINKNDSETTNSQVPLRQNNPSKNEKSSLKSSFVPKLLCLKKNSLEKSNLNSRIQTQNLSKSASNSSLKIENKNPNNFNSDIANTANKTKVVIEKNNEKILQNDSQQINNDSKIISSKNHCNKNEDENSGSNSNATSSRNSQESDYTNYGLEKAKFRNSFHQNVEEALNSLLWQPYEYQKSNRNSREFEDEDDDNDSFYSEASRTPSWSSCSSDLDEVPFDPTVSMTKETIHNSSNVIGGVKKQHPSATGTILQAAQCTYLPSEDLHSNVNNLPPDQSEGRNPSRDRNFERSTAVAFEPVPSLNLAGGTRVAYIAPSRSYSSDRVCDVKKTHCDRSRLSMNVDQNKPVNQPIAVTSGTNSSHKTNENELKPFVDSSLNSANIVGLPSHHARYASVPSSAFQSNTTRLQNTIFPQHVRNISEPATKYPQHYLIPQGNGTELSNTTIQQTNVVPIHHHYSDQNNIRSYSGPKLMSKNEQPTNNTVQTAGIRLPNAQSNVLSTQRNRGHNNDQIAINSNRFPVIQNSLQNSTSSQYQVVPKHAGHQQVFTHSNNALPNISKFSVSPNSSFVPSPTHMSENSFNAPSSSSTQYSVPNPRLAKISTQQQSQINQNEHQNVSNVNVNFYRARAVPVNVVSSVPTIHCLNTLSNDQGNNVSNVQVLPLGSSFQQPAQITNITYSISGNNTVTATNSVRTFDANQNVYTPAQTTNASSATQITLHNANAIKIVPSTGFHINRNSAFCTPAQSTDTRKSQSENVAGVNTMVVPLNQVVVESVRLISTANDTIPSGRTITTTAQINSISELPFSNSQPQIVSQGTNIARNRTFTSTEAQTDDILPVSPQQSGTEQSAAQKEQRRRERRERRHNRRVQRQNQTIIEDNDSSSVQQQNNDRLPDILDSHLPPPYSAVLNQSVSQNHGQIVPQMVSPAGPLVTPQLVRPPGIIPGGIISHGPVFQTVLPNSMPTNGFVFPAPHQQVVPGQVPLMQAAQPVPVAVTTPATGFRFPFPANGFRRSRFSDDTPKGCCGILSWKPGSLRWFIALIALVAVCCVLVGTALGAMRPAGRDHLTVSLLMIGVGIVLITVSGVAWRLTSHDSSTCRSMLGMGSTESVDVCTRRFVPRLPPSYGRPHHPYAAMMYPEFQYRPPPPSYQASMQEYRLRLLLLDRGNTPQIQAGLQNAVSPPPTYRSHAGSLLRAPLSNRRDANQSEYSCPPSYRSQNSSHRPGTLQGSILHSREHSLTVSDSNPGESVVNIVNILGSTEEDIALDNITLDSLKMEPEHELSTLKMLLKGSQSDLEGSKDGNLVTIVQTSDQNPVIVTVSGCSNDNNHSSVQITEIPSEMEILAHL